MAVFGATMHQVGPNRRVCEPPDVAPMKGYCQTCSATVALLRPRSLTFPSGNYIVRGQCEHCAAEVVLTFASAEAQGGAPNA